MENGVPAFTVKTSLLMTFSKMICKPILRRKHICKNIACGVDQILLVAEVRVTTCLSDIGSLITLTIFYDITGKS
jgi:hypothetical protein